MRYWIGPSRDPSGDAIVVLQAASSAADADSFLSCTLFRRPRERKLRRGRREDSKLSGEEEVVLEGDAFNSAACSIQTIHANIYANSLTTFSIRTYTLKKLQPSFIQTERITHSMNEFPAAVLAVQSTNLLHI
jgi:hypothetical protein